jgi:hypothetical protein
MKDAKTIRKAIMLLSDAARLMDWELLLHYEEDENETVLGLTVGKPEFIKELRDAEFPDSDHFERASDEETEETQEDEEEDDTTH